VTEWKWEVNR